MYELEEIYGEKKLNKARALSHIIINKNRELQKLSIFRIFRRAELSAEIDRLDEELDSLLKEKTEDYIK